MNILQVGIEVVERGLVPDVMTRQVMHRLCGDRLRTSRNGHADNARATQARFVQSMRSGPVAPLPHLANQQHYEIPARFFSEVLGSQRKYSCCFWPDKQTTLDEAEDAALEVTCERAQIADGQNILELGCGWGSLSLWMASRYPHSQVTAVSNSASQRQFIESEAAARNLKNVRVITADMNEFSPLGERFDRVVSVEMFEHMRNYEELLKRVATWLTPEGKLFVHIFCHRDLTYPFDTEGAANWMGQYFFSGGIMPSADLLRDFDRSLKVSQQWMWSGLHYQRTADAWLANLDASRRDILTIMNSTYGPENAHRWLNRWRMFFLAVSELFGFADGEEWFVSHYLLEHAS